MPIFEFRCAECGHIFEKIFLNAKDDEAVLACPECACEAVERVVSRTNYTIGAGPGGNQPKISARSCGDSNHCMTLDLPGPSK